MAIVKYFNWNDLCVKPKYVTQRQLMRLFAVKLILSYEQNCKVSSKFLKNCMLKGYNWMPLTHKP